MNRRALVPFLVLACTTFGLGCPGPQPGNNDGGQTTDAGTDAGTPDAGTDAGTPDAGPTATTATATIGFDGGTITLDGATLTFPVGALSQDTQITLTHTIDAPPTGFDQGAVLWRVAPEGVPLARPAAFVLPFNGAPGSAAGFWSTPDGTTFERVALDVDSGNGYAILRPVRLGAGFVGAPSGHSTLAVYLTDTTFIYTPSGTTAQPKDLSADTVEVLVPNASQGYDTYTGTGNAQGIGRITGVPPSPMYYFGTLPSGGGLTLVGTQHAAVDKSSLQDGRTSSSPTGSGTTVTVDGTGMTAWAANDTVEGETLAYAFTGPSSVSFATAPTAGDTSITGGVLDWSSQPMIDDAQGDSILLFHRRNSTLPSGLTYSDILDMATLTNLGMVAGQDVQAQTSFAPVTQVPLSLTVDRPGLQQAIAAYQPPAGYDVPFGAPNFSVALYYTRAPASLGVGTNGVDLLYGNAPADVTTSLPLTLSFGDPAPGQGVRQLYAVLSKTYADSSGNNLNDAFVITAMPLSNVTAGTTLSSHVGVVGSITVAGQTFTGPMSGVGTTPTIAWQPPSVGRADAYWLDIVDMQTGKAALTVMTSATSVAVPSGVLQTGTTYRLSVAALWANGRDPALSYGPGPGGLSLSEAFVGLPTITP